MKISLPGLNVSRMLRSRPKADLEGGMPVMQISASDEGSEVEKDGDGSQGEGE